jgi:uncharacterized membrane protein
VPPKRFSIGEAIGFGWEVTKANFLLLVGLIVLSGLIGGLPQLINRDSSSAGLACIVGLLSTIVNTLIGLGLTNIALKLADRQPVELSDLWSRAHLFLNYLVAEILYGLMVAVGLVLLIVPGIIVAIIFSFFAYVIVDHEAGPIESLSQSAAITKGARMDLFVFGLVLIGLNLLGAIALGVGLFVTTPISMVAVAYVYRQLAAQTGGTTPPGALAA